MGKQVCFFMTHKDEVLFFEFIKEMKDSIFDYYGNALGIEQLSKPLIYTGEEDDADQIVLFYLTIPNAAIEFRKSGGVEQLTSEVIQVSRSAFRNNNQLWNGRIWYEDKYYDDQGRRIKKADWLNKKYNEYQRWIRKNLKPNKDNDFYIGENAYELYKMQGFKMMNAPNVAIEFD